MINRKVQYSLGQFFVQDSTKCLWQKYKKVTNPDFFHDYVCFIYLSFVLLLKNVTFFSLDKYMCYLFLPSQIVKMPTPIRIIKVDIIYMLLIICFTLSCHIIFS